MADSKKQNTGQSSDSGDSGRRGFLRKLTAFGAGAAIGGSQLARLPQPFGKIRTGGKFSKFFSP